MWVGIVKESFERQLCIQGWVRFEQEDEGKADNKFCKESNIKNQFGTVD